MGLFLGKLGVAVVAMIGVMYGYQMGFAAGGDTATFFSLAALLIGSGVFGAATFFFAAFALNVPELRYVCRAVRNYVKKQPKYR